MALLSSSTIIKILLILIFVKEFDFLQKPAKETINEEYVLQNLRQLREWETLPSKFWDQPDEESLQRPKDTVRWFMFRWQFFCVHSSACIEINL